MIFANAFGEQGFRGPAFAYANDADFSGTSTSVKFWTDVITRFFEKYEGVYQHSLNLIRTVQRDGKIINPSGRFYEFERRPHKKTGVLELPTTMILNYPIQGLSADFIMIARNLVYERLHKQGWLDKYKGQILLMNTVHDDVEADVDNDPELVYNICLLLESCFKDIGPYFEKLFGVEVNVPMGGEVKMGWSLYEKEMVKFNPNTFDEDWKKLINANPN